MRLFRGAQTCSSVRLGTASPSLLVSRSMSQKQISVILTDKFDNLGEKGEVVTVRPGHARNHLFPKKMAVYDTEVNRVRFEEFTNSIDFARRDEERKRVLAIARIEKVTVRAKRQVVEETESGKKLHAPIFKQDVVRLLWRQHYIRLGLDDIQMSEKGIETLGVHFLNVKVGSGAEAKLRLELVAR